MKNYRMLDVNTMEVPYVEVRDLEGQILYKIIDVDGNGKVNELIRNDDYVVARIIYDKTMLEEKCHVEIKGETDFVVHKKNGINTKRFDVEGNGMDLNETSWGFSYEIIRKEDLIGKFTIKGNITGIEVLSDYHEDSIIAMAYAVYKIVK